MKTKKILVLSSSARKGGNTDLLCDEFIRGAEAAGHSVEKMYVSFMHIKGCLGCLACQKNGGRCVQKDDMITVYEKMMSADVIVFASPVYYYSFNAQMKALMDRTVAIEYIIKDKIAYLIGTGAAPEPKYMSVFIEGFNKYIGCFNNIVAGGVIIGYGTVNKGDIKGMPVMQEGYDRGYNL